MEEKGIIICVDDEVSVLETLKEQLEEHFSEHHEVLTANSAEEALDLIQVLQKENATIELIISDQVMPGMKGDEFLIEAHKILPDAFKILLTGHAGLESAMNALNYGGLSRYIEKPWNMDTLKDDIASLLQKFRQNLENRRLINRLNERIQQLEASSK
ncbi:MAG: response regulator [Candidatus Hydrogenedentota bacterium]|nr:MAG: response regulator [Candidatus Hydrogenedentota bacterium]